MFKKNKNKFLTQFNVVFNDENEIKVCGREETKKLINYAYSLDKKTDYGNLETGQMNVSNIIKLKKAL